MMVYLMGLGIKTFLKKKLMPIRCKIIGVPSTCWIGGGGTKIVNSELEGANFVGNNTHIIDSTIGYATTIGPGGNIGGYTVGKYCSIAPGFNSFSGSHPSANFVSTCDLFYSIRKLRGFTYVKENKFKEYKYADEEKKKLVVIGNDVWIGGGVSVLDGVTIGDGAIIGAGALIIKDVLPYSIVGGVPARFIRWRFEPKEIEFLLELRWWDKSEEWIKAHVDLFDDIKKAMHSLKIENELY